ncbi:MAG: ABC transporter substrate-binding protein [Alphaproteobacteria bacterium]|nr:ABC transporter substrate-binding protein [Alphaproteobacteria bacterium]
MKRIVTGMLVVTLIFVLALTGCQPAEVPEDTPDVVSEPIVIAALNGPTGMGMVQLMDQTDKYAITTYQAPDEVSGKIITGEVDLACVPSNLAAVLYNKTQGQIVAISVETLGVLYLVENGGETIQSIADLAGKTVYGSGKGGSPEYILQKLLNEAGLTDVTIEWMANHSDVASTLMANQGSIALLPEPFVTVVTSKNPALRVAVDLNEGWVEATGLDLPMGVLVATKSFVEERGDDLAIFLKDYRASVDFVNNNPEEAGAAISQWGFIADPTVATKAIPGSNIVLYEEDTSVSKEMLESFFGVLFEMNPASIGGAMPDEGLYY